jgi:hypothetical protein
MNWINSWKSTNKKNKYNINLRLGKLTIFEIEICFCDDEGCNKFRLMLLNLGFEI